MVELPGGASSKDPVTVVTSSKQRFLHMKDPPQKKTTWLAGKSAFSIGDTPRKTNMEPENQWLEDVFPIKILPS